ncbi:MAG: DUF1295 domain-containing protein [Microbacter sp.]
MSFQFIQTVAYVWLLLALVVHVVMFYVTAPFGRHTTDKWGISINNKWGWFLMEVPSLIIMIYFLALNLHLMLGYSWVLFLLWIVHYLNRSIIYPLRIRSTPKKMPLVIMLSAVFFNVVNASLNGCYLACFAPMSKYDVHWFYSFHFILGIFLFIFGMYVNMKSDNMLIHLRKRHETGYKIPKGFLFDYVTSPNLFGEVIEWTGFALMAWNLPAFTFMVWTFANLVPRAKNHHDWFLRQFPEYPENRKIIFPFVF